MRLRDRVFRAGLWVTAGFLLDKLIAAGQLVFLARLLTPDDFGLMAASAATMLAVLTVSGLGLEPALILKQPLRENDLAVAWSLAVARALVLATIIWFLAPLVAEFFQAPLLASFLRVHALAVLIQGVQSPALALLLRELDMGRRVRLDLVRRVAEGAATIGLALWLRSPWALLGGQLIGFLVGCLLSYRVAPFKPRFSLDRDSLRFFVWFGKHLNLTTILIFLVSSGPDFAIGRLQGTEALGIYQIALAIPILVGDRAQYVMSRVSFPTYALLQGDRAGIVRAFSLQIGGLTLILVPMAVGVAILATEVVEFLFGARWLAAAEPLRILCLYAVCAGFSGVMASLHYGLNRPDFQTRIWGVQFVVLAVMLIPMITWLGLVGAAAAFALSYTVGAILHFLYTVRILGREALPCFFIILRTGLVVGALGVFLVFLRHMPTQSQSGWLVMTGVAASVAAYLGYLWRVEYPRLARLWQGNE